MRWAALLPATAWIASAACASAPENPLAGEWTVVAVRGDAPCVLARGTTVAFPEETEGRARWTVPGPACAFSGAAPYRLAADSGEDLRLTAGPWRSAVARAVEGRVERHGPDRFRYVLDAEGVEAEMTPGPVATVVFVRTVR